MNWSHGYNVSGGYTFGFYRETAPDWLNFAALLNGYRVPDTSGAFRYLELGCGQGFGLCLLAATYPEAEFLGIDFNPEHVAHARELARSAGLRNIRFEEADFSELARRWPADFGQFEYAVLHGIYSWVPEALRQAIVQCLAAATVPGALVYVSYNTLPGWISAIPVQHMLRRLQLQSARPGPQILQQGVQLFESLMAAQAGVSGAQPTLKSRIDSIKTQNASYLVQEYLHENWHPLWFSQAADELAGAKLSHVGSATLPENYLPSLISKDLADVVRAGEGRVMQQALIDLAINQSFRRDIFCRGPRETRRSMALLDQCKLIAGRSLKKARPELGEVPTSFGNLTITGRLLDAVVDKLTQGPASLGELAALDAFRGKPKQDAIQVATLLLHAGHVNLGLSHPAQDSVADFNRAVSKAVIADFASYGCLAARNTPTAVTANDIDMAIYPLLEGVEKPDAKRLATQLVDNLLGSGRTILKNGKVLEIPDEQFSHASELTHDLVNNTLPTWKRLGVV